MPQDESTQLSLALAVAQDILALVDEGAPEKAHSRDRNDQILWLGLARAFRCLRSIRDLVALHQEADDAYILTRALTSIALRSLWMADDPDPDERIRRGRVFTRYSYREAAKQARELEGLGLESTISAQEWDAMAAEIQATGDMPTDVAIAREFSFEGIYSTVYRTASGSVHYSLSAALEGFDPGEGDEPLASLFGLRIRFRDGQPERAAVALLHACLVFVVFLEGSDPLVNHNLSEAAKRVLAERFPDAFENSE